VIDWLVFTVVAVVSNTPLPIAFDPVMLQFARTHPGDEAWVAAVVGALGAGAGGMSEMVAFRLLRRPLPDFAKAVRVPSARWFYPWTAAMALTPIPFTVVRVAACVGRARPGPYGLAIAAGRLPRHAAIVYLASTLTFPSWLGPLTLALAISPLLWMLGRVRIKKGQRLKAKGERLPFAFLSTSQSRTETGRSENTTDRRRARATPAPARPGC
jgi:membrane protein YqaA with SNARE-associated domain